MRSVLQDWVMELPLREQGTLMTAIRGCDLTPKYPLDSPERTLTAAIRYAVMVPVDPREIDSEPGCFMISRPPTFKASALGHYPLHWVTHLMHAAEVIAYRHPSIPARAQWLSVYENLVDSLHLRPEPQHRMIARLSEDRIAKGNIVG